MLDQFVGQKDSLAMLLTTLKAKQQTGEPLPNILLLGTPGRGKTTLASAIADELDVPFVKVHAPSIRDAHGLSEREQMAAHVRKASGGVLMIDEAHSLSRTVTDDLFLAMDEGLITINAPVMVTTRAKQFVTALVQADLPADLQWQWRQRGPGMYSYYVDRQSPTRATVPKQVPVGHVTLIGATTDESLLSPAFLSRLSGLVVRLRPYEPAELGQIAIDHAFGALHMEISAEAAATIAMRSRNTPRRTKQLVERSADWTVAEGRRSIETSDVIATCGALGVDQWGLEAPHRQILRFLADNPSGLSRTSLGQRMGIPVRNFDLYWADLSEMGFVEVGYRHQITRSGRGTLDA